MTASGSVDIQCLFLAEIISMFFAPLLVLSCKDFLRKLSNALTMPKSGHKINPFLAAISTGRAGKKAVYIRKSSIQQGNQVVLEHGLHLGILPVLPVTGF